MSALLKCSLHECLEKVGLQAHLGEFQGRGITTVHQLCRLPQTEYVGVGVVEARHRHSLRSLILALRDTRPSVPIDPSLAAPSPANQNARQAPPPRRASRRGLEMAGVRRPENEQELALFNCRRKLSFEDCDISLTLPPPPPTTTTTTTTTKPLPSSTIPPPPTTTQPLPPTFYDDVINKVSLVVAIFYIF